MAIAAAQVANAAGTHRAKAIQTTQRIAILSSSGSKLTLVGTSDMYTGAHGNFTGSGTKPANSFETFTFKGTVSYR
jgi:hypothetical protein